MLRSPLYDLHREIGAVFREEAGWEVVAHYGHARADALAVREGAGIADLTHRAALVVRGKDRVRFLQAMLTNDVAACTPGTGCYAALLNDKGRVLSDLGLFVADDAIRLDAEAPARATLAPTLERYVILDDVTFADETESRVLLAVEGPNARHVVGQALGAEIPELPEFSHVRIGEVLVARRDRVGEPGYEMHVPPRDAAALFDAARQAGALPVGLDALEMLRIEAGIPRAFVDMDETTLLLEAGLERAISRSKGCYLGQEVVVRALDRGGIKRQLRGLRVNGIEVPARGSKVTLGEREVGQVTSAARSLSLDVPIALAILHRDAWEPGTEVRVGGVAATVSALPFSRH